MHEEQNDDSRKKFQGKATQQKQNKTPMKCLSVIIIIN